MDSPVPPGGGERKQTRMSLLTSLQRYDSSPSSPRLWNPAEAEKAGTFDTDVRQKQHRGKKAAALTAANQ